MTDWRVEVSALAGSIDPLRLARRVPPEDFTGRESAVLIAFAETDAGLELVLIERAHDGTVHAGQPAFPGGAVEDHDVDVTATALREAYEETGLLPEDVTVLAVLPRLFLAVSGFAVTPVLAHWHRPSELRPDPTEVAAVVRVPVRDLVDPANRVMLQHPSGSTGPGFRVAGLVVWGFTGAVISGLLAALGWERAWDSDTVIPLGDA